MQINILSVVIIVINICIITSLYYLLYYKMPYNNVAKQITEVIIIGMILLYGIWLIFIRPRWRRSVCYTLMPDELRVKSGVILSSIIYVRLTEISQIDRIKIPVFYSISLNFILINVSGQRVILKLLSDTDLEEIYIKLMDFHRIKEDEK